MGEEQVADGVGEVVADVTVSPIKSNNEKKDGKKEETEEMCVDTEDGVKDKNKEVNVDQKDAEVSKDHKEGKEVNGIEEEGKDERKEEAKSDAMEVDGAGDASDDKIVQIADSKDTEEKRATKKSGGEKGKNKKQTDEKKNNNEPKTPVGPTIDRPVRERKSVERLVAVIDNDNSKEFRIEKGRGTALKDIPNVAYKLSRKKVPEDTLKLLHSVLFVRRGKALEIKSNILRFSGFVWHENEEKQKAKVQEKLDKFNKEKLFEFCDLLDIPVTKTAARKDDVITKLIDFLLAPHATTSELLAEKEQSSKGNKRKRPHKAGASNSEATLPKDSSKKSKSASEKQKGTTQETESSSEEEEEDESDEHQVNGGPGKSESEEHVSEPESEEEDIEKRTLDSKKPPKTESASKTKSKKQASDKKSNPEMKTATESSAKLSKPKDQSDSHPPTKTFSRKKKKPLADEKTSSPRKSASKEKTGKKDVKEKEAPKEVKLKPSDAELKAAVCDILNEVDFNTATFNDILKLLSEQFRTDLTPRKAIIKSAIHEELSKIAEEENETDTEDGGKQAPARKASRA